MRRPRLELPPHPSGPATALARAGETREEPTPEPPRPGRRSTLRVHPHGLLAVDLAVPVVAAFVHPATVPAMLAMAVALTASFRSTSLYRRRFTEQVLDDLPLLSMGLVAAGAAAAAVTAFTARPVDSLAPVVGALVAVVLVGRAVLYRCSRAGLLTGEDRVLVLGTGDVAHDVALALEAHAGQRLRLVGFVGSGPHREHRSPVLGGIGDFAEIVEEHHVDVVIVALPHMSEWRLAQLVRRRTPARVRMYTVPVGYSLGLRPGAHVDRIWAVPVLPLRSPSTHGPAWRTKRVLDVVLSGVALVALSPLLAATALAVRLEGGPGVIFRQERVGLSGDTFTLFKFRSMRASAEESATQWTVTGDPRIGPVGRFIRATSIDELPQLVNILRGEMSIVGPRPERPAFVEEFRTLYPDYDDRHRTPAGLTGYAAVNGLRGDTSIEHRVHFDNLYIDNWSLWEDTKVVLRTLGSVLGRRGG